MEAGLGKTHSPTLGQVNPDRSAGTLFRPFRIVVSAIFDVIDNQFIANRLLSIEEITGHGFCKSNDRAFVSDTAGTAEAGWHRVNPSRPVRR